MQPFRTDTYGTGAVRLRIERFGLPEGKPVVLLHGLCGSNVWWRRTIPALAGEYQVLSVELGGYGGNRDACVAPLLDVVGLMGQWLEGIPEGRASIVGHSMGGLISLHLAADHPERVDRLVLASASVSLEADFLGMMGRLPLEALRLQPSFAPVLAYDALRAGPLNLFRSTRQIVGHALDGAPERVTAPTLLIWGRNDRLVPVAVGEMLERRIAGARLVVLEGAAHVVMWDQAARFNALVGDFLKGDQRNST